MTRQITHIVYYPCQRSFNIYRILKYKIGEGNQFDS